MNFKLLFTLIVSIISITACRKYVTDISPEYEGEWHSLPVADESGTDFEMYFVIEGESIVFGKWCELVPLGSNCSRVYEGEVKFNRNKSKFYIGSLFDQVVLEVNESPHVNDNYEWECTVGKRVYTKN